MLFVLLALRSAGSGLEWASGLREAGCGNWPLPAPTKRFCNACRCPAEGLFCDAMSEATQMERSSIMMTRRQAIKRTALASAALASAASLQSAPAPVIITGGPQRGPFSLPALPYPFDALEPHIDARTMEIHHDKHHAAYVANLNKAAGELPEVGKKPIEDLLKELSALPEPIRTTVRNQGGGHYNHSLFWQMMKKDGGGEPTGELAKAMEKSFGTFDKF